MGTRGYFKRRKTETIRLDKFSFNVLGLQGEWVADRDQQRAAWEMYVELVTRIAVVPLGPSEGLLREALSSLYALFGETRRILKEYGPGIAIPLETDTIAFGQLAVTVLNRIIRPVLAKWHPLLEDHEARRPPDRSRLEHEQAWERAGELREELERLRGLLGNYAAMLAAAAGVEPLESHATPAD
jgi:hypothetical protein